MQTRTALMAFGGQSISWGDGPLAKIAQRLVADLKARDEAAQARPQPGSMAFVDAMRKYVAMLEKEALSEVDLPMVLRLDASSVFSNAARGDRTDHGLAVAAALAKTAFEHDPVGALTISEVSYIRDRAEKAYPRSKCADVIERDLAPLAFSAVRAGGGVRELNRMAAQLENAPNLERAFIAACNDKGLNTNSAEHLRARGYVRALLSMSDRVVDRVAQAIAEGKDAFDGASADLGAVGPESHAPGGPDDGSMPHDEGSETGAEATSPNSGLPIVVEIGAADLLADAQPDQPPSPPGLDAEPRAAQLMPAPAAPDMGGMPPDSTAGEAEDAVEVGDAAADEVMVDDPTMEGAKILVKLLPAPAAPEGGESSEASEPAFDVFSAEDGMLGESPIDSVKAPNMAQAVLRVGQRLREDAGLTAAPVYAFEADFDREASIELGGGSTLVVRSRVAGPKKVTVAEILARVEAEEKAELGRWRLAVGDDAKVRLGPKSGPMREAGLHELERCAADLIALHADDTPPAESRDVRLLITSAYEVEPRQVLAMVRRVTEARAGRMREDGGVELILESPSQRALNRVRTALATRLGATVQEMPAPTANTAAPGAAAIQPTAPMPPPTPGGDPSTPAGSVTPQMMAQTMAQALPGQAPRAAAVGDKGACARCGTYEMVFKGGKMFCKKCGAPSNAKQGATSLAAQDSFAVAYRDAARGREGQLTVKASSEDSARRVFKSAMPHAQVLGLVRIGQQMPMPGAETPFAAPPPAGAAPGGAPPPAASSGEPAGDLSALQGGGMPGDHDQAPSEGNPNAIEDNVREAIRMAMGTYRNTGTDMATAIKDFLSKFKELVGRYGDEGSPERQKIGAEIVRSAQEAWTKPGILSPSGPPGAAGGGGGGAPAGGGGAA